MYFDFALLIIGFVGLFVSLTAYKVAARSKDVSKQATNSKSVDRAMFESGLYIEHGMVNSVKNTHVKPEYKLSNSFFESLH